MPGEPLGDQRIAHKCSEEESTDSKGQRKSQEQGGEESDGKGSEDTPNKGGSSQHTLTLERLGTSVEMISEKWRRQKPYSSYLISDWKYVSLGPGLTKFGAD